MSAYTRAWLEVHATADADLRERLQDARTLLHEIAAELDDCREPEDIPGAFGAMRDELAEVKENAEARYLEHDDEKAALVQKHEDALDKLRLEHAEECQRLRDGLAIQAAAVCARLEPRTEGAVEGPPEPPVLKPAPARQQGTVIHVDFTKGRTGGKTAYELYAEASAIDEDPKKYAEAEQLYRSALAIDPAMAIARVNLGNIFYRRGQRDDAKREYDQAIKDMPTCPEAQYNRGYLELDAGRPREAFRYFLLAIEQDPKFPDAHFNAAMALEQCGDPHTARWHFERYLEIEPSGVWANIARSHLSASGGQRSTAAPALPDVVAKAKRKRTRKGVTDGLQR